MRITADIPDHGALVMAIMEGFVTAAELEIRAGIVPPSPLAVPGLKFVPETAENWQLPHQVLQSGQGDCEDICFWECAGYRVTGADSGATCVLVQTGETRLHCVVRLSDGSIQDPSAVLKAANTASKLMRKRGGVPGKPRASPTLGAGVFDIIRPGSTPGQQAGIRVTDHRKSSHGQADAGERLSKEYVQSAAESVRPKVEAYLEQHGPGFSRQIQKSSPYSTFGASKKRGYDAEGLDLVVDDQDPSGTPFYQRTDEITKAAWDAGMSGDELRELMSYQGDADSYGYAGGYPSFDVFGGYPNPFGMPDPYAGWGMGPFMDYGGGYGWPQPPDAYYQGVSQGDFDSDLGIDTENVIDTDATEEA